MIPFIGIDDSKLAPFHPYGIMVAIAFFVGEWAMMRFAVKRGYDRGDFRVCFILLGVFGWFFAWLVDVLFYRLDHLEQGVSALQGFSSTGAIAGAFLGGFFWTRYDLRGWKLTKRETPHALLPLTEVVLATWPIPFAFGRVGCALIHDHVGASAVPGTLGSLFAVGFPRDASDGVHHVFGPVHLVTGASDLRYDLGLLEVLVLGPLALAFARMWNKPVPMGNYTIIASLVYGPVRFILDFLRASEGPSGEARQGGLTFAQYFSIGIVVLAIVLLVRRRRTGAIEPAKATS
ncbi:MAG: prolipoprotein diacylglyceryl transferase [Labilithrix sp.]|nr:prolipoprotein diacylglyceryl transferase [Labilithrix sp.]MCW5817992.1 prolipoprotein diacylglyceryl transferase [Labilithrix sp.]